jgi:hypothetical protein
VNAASSGRTRITGKFGTVGPVRDFPFVYLNHRVLSADNYGPAASMWIAFDAPLTAERLQWMIDTCPEPLAGVFYADEALFHCETAGPETFESAVSRLYGDGQDITPAVARRFCAALDEWACRVDEWTPIAFVCGPGTAQYGEFYRRARAASPGSHYVLMSQWAIWSAGQMPEVVDWLEDYLDTFEGMPLTEYDAVADENWPALPMNRLTLSFIVDNIPVGTDPVYDESDDPYIADRVDDLRAWLDSPAQTMD